MPSVSCLCFARGRSTLKPLRESLEPSGAEVTTTCAAVFSRGLAQGHQPWCRPKNFWAKTVNGILEVNEVRTCNQQQYFLVLIDASAFPPDLGRSGAPLTRAFVTLRLLALHKVPCLASSPHVQHLCMAEKGSPTPWSYFLIRCAPDASDIWAEWC